MKTKRGSVYVAQINRPYKDKVYTTYLLRRSYREDGKVKQQTLANLSHLPVEAVELVRRSLRGETMVPLAERLEIVQTRPHGHVAAVHGMLRKLGLHEIIDPRSSRERNLVEAMIIARVLKPQTKLATSRWWHLTTLPQELDVADATEDDLYATMDWLLERQPQIEAELAKRHLAQDSLVLYDVSSSYFEGRCCPLADFGHNRDGKKGKRQVVYGLMTNAEGCPVAIEVFRGNTADPRTVGVQTQKLKKRFGLERVVLVGDRGMITSAQIEKIRELNGIEWISALRAKSIQKLARQGLVQLSLFDQRDLVEITSPDFPGERLVACRNPLLAEDRARVREELLQATEHHLDRVVRRVAAGKLKRKEKIGLAVGAILNRYKMGKHFKLETDEGRFSYRRNEASIQQEAYLDGIYILRTSVPVSKMNAEQVVTGYKSLSHAERAFRTFKGVDLKIRPIHHRLSDRVRAHVFLCMLAYYVEWHLRRVWKSMLFDDEEPGLHEDDSVVRPALRSEHALRKAHTQKREDGQPVHSFQTLLETLATVARNRVRVPAMSEIEPFCMITVPDPLQQEALDRIGISLSLDSSRQKHPA